MPALRGAHLCASGVVRHHAAAFNGVVQLLPADASLAPIRRACRGGADAVSQGEVRAIVNAALVAGGVPALMELPRGQRRVLEGCPLQNALDAIGVVSVDRERLACARPEQAVTIAAAWGDSPAGLSGLFVALPEPLRAFVSGWDSGKLKAKEALVA